VSEEGSGTPGGSQGAGPRRGGRGCGDAASTGAERKQMLEGRESISLEGRNRPSGHEGQSAGGMLDTGPATETRSSYGK